MIVLVASYYGSKGSGDTIKRHLRDMAAEVAQHEPGCALYHACRSRDDSDFFLLYEQYTDEAALEAHRTTPYFRTIIEGTIVPLLEKRERALYDLAVG